MKTWPWWKICLKIICSPRLLIAWYRAPKDYSTFDGWHRCNLAKVPIVTRAIGCGNPDHLIEQENELMAYRKGACPTIQEWFEKSGIPIYAKPIANITGRYAKERKCHRQFDGPDAGIVCYCGQKDGDKPAKN